MRHIDQDRENRRVLFPGYPAKQWCQRVGNHWRYHHAESGKRDLCAGECEKVGRVVEVERGTETCRDARRQRIGSIKRRFGGSTARQRVAPPCRRRHLPPGSRGGSPGSVQIGVTPLNSSRRRPRWRTYPPPASFPDRRYRCRTADDTA